MGKHFCVIHAGSGNIAKNWHVINYIKLADMIFQRTSIIPIFTVGEADMLIEEELKKNNVPYPVFAHRPLLELTALIHRAAFYIGNDSGVTHLAAAMGKPVVALFGFTNPRVWCPIGDKVRIIHAPYINNIEMSIKPEKVFEIIADMFR